MPSLYSSATRLRLTKLPAPVRGLASALRVRSCQFTDLVTHQTRPGLEIEGSFTKFLHGHNLFGSSNPRELTRAVVQVLRAKLSHAVNLSDADLAQIDAGMFEILRADLTCTYRCSEHIDPKAWLTAAEYGIRHRRERPGRVGNTLYIRQRSSRWSIKLYLKDLELKSNPLPAELAGADQLTQSARNTLRVELVLRQPEIRKLSLRQGSAWSGESAATTFRQYFGRLRFRGSVRWKDDIKTQLSKSELKTYCMWLAGVNILALLAPATFSKHQRRFMTLGIDLLSAPDADVPSMELGQVFNRVAHRPSGLDEGDRLATKQPATFWNVGTHDAHMLEAGNDEQANIAA